MKEVSRRATKLSEVRQSARVSKALGLEIDRETSIVYFSGAHNVSGEPEFRN